MHLDGVMMKMMMMIELFFYFSLAEMVKEENHICSIYKPMLFIPWEIYHFVLRKYIELSLYIYAKCKNVHPVFEKLEFYLNLKNDFALTFYTRRA